ncbi:hypothetical protein Dsin_009218 [Dipteronia sinensis]|uniref:Uncharacterized protein n=1 Tax=Dipteronia sinensis TaxID=43782 RepID=A0AAE0AQ79_9ROSI|nr:hypothetical protein Dsin_009218 [Dipteronia sinensis]
MSEKDIEDEHREARIVFSPERVCAYDVEPNVVGPEEVIKYTNRFDLDSDTISLNPANGRAAWNPPPGQVAIYGAMLSYGVTLPLQPFITWFLAEAQLAPAQLTPNSYRILMCMWHMWHRMGRPPPTPREIRYFYSLRPLGKSGIYFLLSTQPESWVPKDVIVKNRVMPTADEKMKGFVWGFPTSNKFRKNSWFFVGGDWGRSISFDIEGSQMTRRVPRYFCAPQWNHMTLSFTDEELKTMTRAAFRPVEKRGRPYLFDEKKMITARLFPQLSARWRRLCDAQARRMTGIVEVSRREVKRQQDAGIAPPQGDSDGSSSEDIPEGDAGDVPDYMPEETQNQELAAHAADEGNQAGPSTKGKEKVGESSEPATFSCGTGSPRPAVVEPSATSPDAEIAREHPDVTVPEILISAELNTAPSGSGAEMGRSDPDFEDPTVDLNTRGRQPRKRKASFSPGLFICAFDTNKPIDKSYDKALVATKCKTELTKNNFSKFITTYQKELSTMTSYETSSNRNASRPKNHAFKEL